LPEVSKSDPSYQSLRIYFFGTPKFLTLGIAKHYQVSHLIVHVIALGDTNSQVKEWLTQGLPDSIKDNYRNPELYEMRLLEDEEDEEAYIPLYETGPLDKKGQIGAFFVSGVVFCRIKEYEQSIKELNNSNTQ
jgi:hypothetical protein